MRNQFICNENTAVAETTKGKIRGYIYNQITIFKGIPYATAKRFQAPKPLENWQGVKECTSYGFVCPLMEMGKPNGELMVPHRYWPMDEDCQNLNIWTPGLDDKKRPVMVWLHGGGFSFGSAIEQEVYDGHAMATNGDVVVVSINHRLNILGYLDVSAFGPEYENSGNAGTDDIIAALQWIHDNIQAFGGDPENVCVFGQSGGGAKVTTLLQSPAADGLYAKGINMSGVLPILIPDQHPDHAETSADHAETQVDHAETSSEHSKPQEIVLSMMEELRITTIEELAATDYHDLAKAYLKVKDAVAKNGGYIGCAPMVNPHYYGNPVQYGFRLETKDIPLLVGSVFGEFLAFMPPILPKTTGEEELKAYYSTLIPQEQVEELIREFKKSYPERSIRDLMSLDAVFRGPEIPYIKERSRLNSCTWAYLFNEDFEMDYGRTPWHCTDIPYVFHNCSLAPVCQQEGMEELEHAIFSTVMAFARTSDPNNDAIPEWKASAPEEEHMLIAADRFRTAVNFDHSLIEAYQKYVMPVSDQLFAHVMEHVQH